MSGFNILQSTNGGVSFAQVDALGGGSTSDTLSALPGAMDTSEFEVKAAAGSSTAISSPLTPAASTNDTDGDGTNDNVDGWAGFTDKTQEAKLAPPRLPNPTYVAVTISTIPNTNPDGSTNIVDFVNAQGQAVVETDSAPPTEYSDHTAVYSFWDKGATNGAPLPTPVDYVDPFWSKPEVDPVDGQPIPASTFSVEIRQPTGLSDDGTVIGRDSMTRGVPIGENSFVRAWRWIKGMSQVQILGDLNPAGIDQIETTENAGWNQYSNQPLSIKSVNGVDTIYAYHQDYGNNGHLSPPEDTIFWDAYTEVYTVAATSLDSSSILAPTLYYSRDLTDNADLAYLNVNSRLYGAYSGGDIITPKGSHESRIPMEDNGNGTIIGYGATMETYASINTNNGVADFTFDSNVQIPSTGAPTTPSGIAFEGLPLEPQPAPNNTGAPPGGAYIASGTAANRYWINGTPLAVNSQGYVLGAQNSTTPAKPKVNAFNANPFWGDNVPFLYVFPYYSYTDPANIPTFAIWAPQTSGGTVTGYTPITLTMPQAGLSFSISGVEDSYRSPGVFFNKNLQIAGGFQGDPNAITGENTPFLWQNYQYHHLNDFFPALSTYAKFQVTGLDDNGAITAIATPSTPANASQQILQLCPVAVVNDPTNTYQVNNTNPVLTYVQFGLWDSAFSTINPPPAPYTATLAIPTLNNGNDSSGQANFVGADSKRFYLRVYDPSAIGNPAVVQTVTANWFTQLPGGAMDDDGNLQGHPPGVDTVTLTETAAGSGLFASKALMLVSDDVDNAQPTNTGLQGAGSTTAAIGVADHRLRRAVLGDTMCYSYTPAATGSTKQTFSLPIFGGSEPIKNITIHFVEAKTATHNTINSGDITNMETQISARWAVAGIQTQPNYVYNATTDVLDVTSTGVDLNNVDGNGIPGGQLYEIAQALRTKYGAYNPSDPTIWVIVIGKFNATTGALGLSFTNGLAAQDLANGFITSLSQMNPILHCSFLEQTDGTHDIFTAYPAATPHEVGHQLSDQAASDAGPPNYNNHYVGLNMGQNLMYFRTDDGTVVTDAKRLWDDPAHSDGVHTNQIDHMRQSPLCH